VGIDTIHDGFFSQEIALWRAIFVGISRQKTRQQARRFRAPFTAKARPKKSPSKADYGFVNRVKYWC
jgi:hypothetical protein